MSPENKILNYKATSKGSFLDYTKSLNILAETLAKVFEEIFEKRSSQSFYDIQKVLFTLHQDDLTISIWENNFLLKEIEKNQIADLIEIFDAILDYNSSKIHYSDPSCNWSSIAINGNEYFPKMAFRFIQYLCGPKSFLDSYDHFRVDLPIIRNS